MRILALTNLYPPRHVGGYELACADVVSQLSRRGKAIEVLTSWRGFGGPRVVHKARRLLRIQAAFDVPFSNVTHELVWNLWNRAILARCVNRFSPDVILAFNLGGLGHPVVHWLQSQPIPVVHEVADKALLTYRPGAGPWPAIPFPHSAARAVLLRLVGMKPRPIAIDLRRSYFRSEFLKQTFRNAGFEVACAPVIHYGIVLPARLPAFEDRPLSILFAGRICEEKGVHVILEALEKLSRSAVSAGGQIRVTLAGPLVGKTSYLRYLEEKARSLAPAFSVRIPGPIPRQELSTFMTRQAIFVFPVLAEEGFGIALLEAMAAGLAVVATGTGGSAELLRDQENALVVRPGDAGALAAALERLVRNVDLRVRLAKEARRTAEQFRLDRTIERIQAHLEAVVSKRSLT